MSAWQYKPRTLRPTTIAWRARAFCVVCGHKTVPTDPNDVEDYTWSNGRGRKRGGTIRPAILGRCTWCHAMAADWTFLKEVERLPDDTTFVLACPYRAPYPDPRKQGLAWDNEHWRKWYDVHGSGPCTGTFTFTIKQLHGYPAVGGNGPATYWLFCRFGMQGRCAVCENYSFWKELAQRNREVFLALLEPLQQEHTLATSHD